MTRSSASPGEVRAIARLRLAKVPVSRVADAERPPVFHVFEELYARTLREMEARSCSAALVAGNPASS